MPSPIESLRTKLLLSPEILEPRWRQLSVPYGVLNVLMAEISLQRSCVVASVGERVATGVPEHVRVCLDRQLGSDARSFNHAGEAGRREWSAALRGEHEGRLRLLFALEPAEGPQLVPEDRMCAGSALLDPADVQGGGPEVHLLPPQVGQFGNPKAMPVGHKDHGRVPGAVTVSRNRLEEALDLGLREMLAAAQVAVRRPLRNNCSIYGGWRDQLQVPFCHEFRSSKWLTVGIRRFVLTVYQGNATAAI